MAEKASSIPSAQSTATVPEESPPSETKRRSTAMVAAIVIALTIAAGAAVAWFVCNSRDDPTQAVVPAGAALTVVPLDGFTVNLNDAEENHFLRVTMNLAVERLPTPLIKDKPSSGLPMARIRDTVVSVLTDCKADALLTREGKQQLKKNLIDSLNRDVPALGVREIYFTEFLVQR